MSEGLEAPTSPLYAKLPYPADGVIRTTTGRVLRRGAMRFAAETLSQRPLRILDVGCGTGEVTCGLSRIFPEAEVVAVDVNPPSLELASRLARKHGLSIRTLHCDATRDLPTQLAALDAWDDKRPFQLVTSMGVLHHLANPGEGFRQLRRLIADDGLFLCYIYSRYGRWRDILVRETLDRAAKFSEFEQRAQLVRTLRLGNKHTSWRFLMGLARRLKFGPPLSVVEIARVYFTRSRLTHFSDTYSNPSERFYNWPDLRKTFEEAAWLSLGLAKGGGLPTTPEEHTSNAKMLATLKSLPEDLLYDYFALYYEAGGFQFFLRPA